MYKRQALSRHPRISVFDCFFSDRSSYVRTALDFVASFSQERCVLFLDPDTGLEPNGGGDTKHVLNTEAREFWDALPKGWLYVFYQHKLIRLGNLGSKTKEPSLPAPLAFQSTMLGLRQARKSQGT